MQRHYFILNKVRHKQCLRSWLHILNKNGPHNLLVIIGLILKIGNLNAIKAYASKIIETRDTSRTLVAWDSVSIAMDK